MHTPHRLQLKPTVTVSFSAMVVHYTVPCGSDHYVHTTVASTAAAVRKWVGYTKYLRSNYLRRGRLVVGLGVQWVPGHASAATLQLCVGHRCLIFQISHASHCPAVLRRFLADPDVILVGFSNYRDAEMLMRSSHALKVRRLVNVGEVARDLRGCNRRASMGELAEEILGMYGMEKDERVGMSDWDDEQLSTEQVVYACHDVFLAFLMAKELRVWNWGDDD